MPMRRSEVSNSALRGPSSSFRNARASAVFPGRIGITRQTGSIHHLQRRTPDRGTEDNRGHRGKATYRQGAAPPSSPPPPVAALPLPPPPHPLPAPHPL